MISITKIWKYRDTFAHPQCHIYKACPLMGHVPRGIVVRDAELSSRIKKARLIAGELWEMLREDAAHRLGLAGAYPQALDKGWSPEFYRKCQLAERLFAILDDVEVQDAAANMAAETAIENDGAPDQVSLKSGKVVPHTAGNSRRRFRI
ncbi:MAG: hypothetical protein A3H91_02385 [Gammaproteobacteria bacterium RIFCSPLOWO2_02_FULL_61_13]|nr:MAG: hypothetical protein A3H91_02385 [Gammaproteobacteria bacterium RIFCSPLOWO2_02_FULL_61_13]